MSLLFPSGKRPRASEVDRALSAEATRPPAGAITHRPDSEEGWLELLASGLTFDLAGLRPGPAADNPGSKHFFGFGESPDSAGLEAVSLAPGQHVAGGGAMIPLVRVMAGLAASLSLGLRARAVVWHPARTCMEPAFFARIVRDWLAGGPFPALGLTAVEPNAVGGVRSVGLAFFTGQEMMLEGKLGESRVDAVKLAVKLIDFLVRQGRIGQRMDVSGPDGEALIAEPSADARRVMVWRQV